jgi:CheY-like chemotaxis protein
MAQPCVLIVEPDLPVRHPVAEYLRGCGYQVLEAVNTDEAMTLLLKKTDIDVVLVDISSPGSLDVFELSRWIRERKHAAQILLAGTHQKITEHAGKLCEEGPHLKKPYHHQQLHDEIKRLIASHKRSNDGE